MPEWKEHIRRCLARQSLDGARELAIIEEISQYLEDCYAEARACGAAEEEAVRIALAELDQGELLGTEIRHAITRPLTQRMVRGTPGSQASIPLGKERSGNMLSDLGQDLRFGMRMLRKHPAFTAVVVMVLALGIGANTAIFSVVNAMLLNPYPFPEPGRIVTVEAHHVSGRNSGTGYRDFLDWRAQNAVFEEMALPAWSASYTLTGSGEPERITGTHATAGFLRVLGVQPAIGRFFTAEEDQPGAPQVAVLSYAAWRRRFGGSADVLGRVIMLDGKPATIIGVMPKAFAYPGMRTCDFWQPLQDNPANDRYQHQYHAIARLKPGITVSRAQADMTAIACRLEQQYPATNTGWAVTVTPIGRTLAEQTAAPVTVLFAAVVLVLLLACANVAGLMLARASGRAKEMAVRASLGANRGRIVRQMLTESVLLACAGGALGLAFAPWFVDVVRAAAPPDFGLESALRIDSTVFGFTLVVSLLTGVVFGLAPALFGSKADLNTGLKGGIWCGGGARLRTRFQSALVAGEVALSLMLLVGAGLLMRDLLLILRLDTGVQVERVLTFTLDLPQAKYATAQLVTNFYTELISRLRSEPSVTAAGAVGTLPMTGQYSGGGFEIEGRPKPADWMEMDAQYNSSTPGYFRTVEIPLLRGRDFDERDTAAGPPVAIINDTLARRFFPGEDPVGHRIRCRRWLTIVGVAGSVKHQQPMNAPVSMVYFPYTQAPDPGMWVTIRTESDPQKLAAAVHGTVRALDRDLAVLKLRTMRQVIADSLIETRLIAWFIAGFAAFALALAAVGIYGVIAYSVSQRTHEMGVRIALGASYDDVMTLVLKKGALLAGAGIVIGVPAALAASRVMASLLYGVSPHDGIVFIGVPCVLLLVALAASYVPARRAAKVDPVVALRAE